MDCAQPIVMESKRKLEGSANVDGDVKSGSASLGEAALRVEVEDKGNSFHGF